jgi:dephospho-CoA kinase
MDRQMAPSGARVPLIGLIGPIGSGKSTVAGFLAKLGATVVDADRLTREMMSPGKPLTEEIIRHFGPEFRLPDGSLDRSGLGRLVFSDPVRLAELESIVHPAVNARLFGLVAEAGALGPSAVVLEAIKLVEAGFAKECDEVWLLVCDPATQFARLIGRGMDESDARQRIAAQAESLPLWRASATRVVDTGGSLPDLERVVAATFADTLRSLT